jgi:hypothetical protein
MCTAPKFGEDGAVKLEQANRALGIRSQGEKFLFEVELGGNTCSKLEGNRRFKVDYRLADVCSCEVECLIVEADAFFPLAASGSLREVGQKVHFGLQKVARVVECLDFETVAAFAKDVEKPIGIAIQRSHNERCATDNRKAFALCTDHAKNAAARLALADHFLVPVLKNMQRKKGSGKEHCIEREQGEFHAAAIMHALLWIETDLSNSLLIA